MIRPTLYAPFAAAALMLTLTSITPLQAEEEPERWRLQLNGKEVGWESVSHSGVQGRALTSSQAEVKITEQPFKFEQELVLDEEGGFEGYTLSSTTHHLKVKPAGEGVLFEGTVVGNPQRRTVAAEGLLVCLDNLVFSHYDVLGRHAVAEKRRFALTVVVPQALTVVPGVFRPSEERFVARRGEETRQARTGRLTVANLLVRFVYDDETGAAYRVEIPAQHWLAEREGWQLISQAQEGQSGPPAAAYREEVVTFKSPYGQIPGTFTLPTSGAAPFPTVLMLSGSGPNDRDETIGPNKPFRDLAHGLAARGVATLRFDKRTYLFAQALKSSGDAEERARLRGRMADLGLEEEYLEDARAALGWLAMREDVRRDRVFLLGHSLGGLAVPMLTRETRGLRGAILMATAGRRMEVLLEEQLSYQQSLLGKSDEEIQAYAEQVLGPLRRALSGKEEPEGSLLGAPVAYWQAISFDPLPRVRKLKLPVLLLQGAEDCQIRVRDYELLKATLEEREDQPLAAHLFPKLNHLFIEVEGQSTGAEYAEPGTVAAVVVERLAAWVQATSK